MSKIVTQYLSDFSAIPDKPNEVIMYREKAKKLLLKKKYKKAYRLLHKAKIYQKNYVPFIVFDECSIRFGKGF